MNNSLDIKSKNLKEVIVRKKKWIDTLISMKPI